MFNDIQYMSGGSEGTMMLTFSHEGQNLVYQEELTRSVNMLFVDYKIVAELVAGRMMIHIKEADNIKKMRLFTEDLLHCFFHARALDQKAFDQLRAIVLRFPQLEKKTRFLRRDRNGQKLKRPIGYSATNSTPGGIKPN